MPETIRLVTAGELERFPDDDHRYELVDGRIVRMSPVGYPHGRVVAHLLVLLEQHVRPRNLGETMTEVGFTLRTDPDTVRAPDIAFIRRDRIPAAKPRGFWKGTPDLAAEVLSPDDRPGEIRAKVEEYLRFGVPLVLIIDADEETVTAHRPSAPPTVLTSEAMLDLGDVVSGFRCTVSEIFE
jgi:Uma2 family endonuclease